MRPKIIEFDTLFKCKCSRCYQLNKQRKLNIGYFYIFGCKCHILKNNKDNIGKFDAKLDEGIFLEYSIFSKAYRVFDKIILVFEESMHVVLDKSIPSPIKKNDDDENIGVMNIVE